MRLEQEDCPVTANFDPINTAALAAANQPPARATSTSTSGSVFGAALVQAQQSLGQADSVAQSAPPPELAAHIEAAARAWDALSANSQHISFSESPDGRIRIELHDQDGNHLESLSGVGLFDLIDQEGGR
jgi:hypothetical protein